MGVDIRFATHAATTDDEAGRVTGWRPGELSAHGLRNARELGEQHRGDRLAAVFCSDLARAVQTVGIAFAGFRIPIHRDTRLRDCDYGELTGSQVVDLAPLHRQHIEHPFPGGQSYRQVVEQTRGFLRDLALAWDDHRVLIVAHPVTRWALAHLIEGTPLTELVGSPEGGQPGRSYLLPSVPREPTS